MRITGADALTRTGLALRKAWSPLDTAARPPAQDKGVGGFLEFFGLRGVGEPPGYPSGTPIARMIS